MAIIRKRIQVKKFSTFFEINMIELALYNGFKTSAAHVEIINVSAMPG